MTLPVNNLHLVPDSLSDEEACFAEPLAAAWRIAEQQVHWQNRCRLNWFGISDDICDMDSEWVKNLSS